MIDRDSPVTEDELHAYIDGELPADRKEAIANWLADHPEQAALVASWRAQAEGIRARYGAVGEEPVPERLKLEQVLSHDRKNGRSWAVPAAAAAIVAFVLGGSTGWVARGASARAPTGFDVHSPFRSLLTCIYIYHLHFPVDGHSPHLHSFIRGGGGGAPPRTPQSLLLQLLLSKLLLLLLLLLYIYIYIYI